MPRDVRAKTIVVWMVLVAICISRSPTADAQSVGEYKAADTSSPRATLRSFIDACNQTHDLIKNDWFLDRSAPKTAHLGMRMLDCMDLSALPAFAREQRAGEVATCIKEILDREELPPWQEIPDQEMIESKGGFEKLSRWRVPGTRITIARIEEGPQRHEYLFTAGTVERAVDYFKQIESQPYRSDGPAVSAGLYRWYMSAPGNPTLGAIVNRLPRWWKEGRTYGLTNWKWPGLSLLLAITVLSMWLTYRIHGSLTRRVKSESIVKYCLTIAFPAVAVVLPLLFLNVCEDQLTIRGKPLYVISFCSIFVAILASVFLVFSASNRVAEAIISSPQINPQGLNAQLIRIVSRLFSLTASVAVVLVGGQYLGIPLTTLLASAGIGGIAIALGAQDTLKTLFGTLALMADKPFRVGERIVFDKYDGVVEDIGLRSTRLRLLTGHLVTLPNDQLARSDIENVGRRRFIRRSSAIHIPLTSSSKQVEKAVEIIRELLQDHDGMDAEYPPRVFFDELGPEAFEIRFIYWYTPPEYWEFKALSDRLNFEIFRSFERHGIEFSMPQRHTFSRSDEGLEMMDVEPNSQTNRQQAT